MVGHAATDNSSSNAFIWREGDSKITGLGTLKADNSGTSYANGVSADGRIVVGSAATDSGNSNAFIWREGDSKMTGLGTLRADNSGVSNAYGVSADGSVVIGRASSDYGTSHAVVWKVKPSVPPVEPPVEPPIDPVDPPVEPPINPPIKPPVVTIVDATNSSQAMADTGHRGFNVLGLYQNSLNALSQNRCQLGLSDYCVGVLSQYDTLSSNQRVATGLFGTVRLPAETWTFGGAINFANRTNLVDNYDTRGNNRPGVGLFTRYQHNRDGTGLNAELSGAFLQQGLTITRDALSNTEAGEGHSTIKGTQVRLNVQYGVAINPKTLVSPEMSLTYHKVTRDGYTEKRNAEFAATYGNMGQTRKELQLGVNTVHLLSKMVQLDGNVGAAIKLSSENDAFTGHIPYIGAYAYEAGTERAVSPHAAAGINVNMTASSTLRANIGWQQTDYRHDATNVSISYSYHW